MPDAPQFHDEFFSGSETDRFDAMMMATTQSPLQKEMLMRHPYAHPLEHGDPCSGQRFDAEPPDPNESWDQELRDCPPACEQEKVEDDPQQAAA